MTMSSVGDDDDDLNDATPTMLTMLTMVMMTATVLLAFACVVWFGLRLLVVL